MNTPILVVDDEAPTRELLALFFRTKGLEVITANTAHDAKKLAATTRFSLAILDVALEGEDGLELLSYFRANHPTVRVIIFTGLTDQDLVDKAMAGGASGFMNKCDPLESLFGTVSRFLPQ